MTNNELNKRVAEALERAKANGYDFKEGIDLAEDLTLLDADFENCEIEEILPSCELALLESKDE